MMGPAKERVMGKDLKHKNNNKLWQNKNNAKPKENKKNVMPSVCQVTALFRESNAASTVFDYYTILANRQLSDLNFLFISL